ncbi:hypothetical protein GOP47_0026927 [Adiantum capillus-veneris]|nr:hypothetical protein GOP47_0026927 [Adiantum capillus-veneris]
MGGGYPFEQLDTDEDCMDVNASSIISPSALATSNNQANNIPVSHHSMEQQTGENIGLMDWMEYVQVRPSDTETSSSSIPAAFHDNDNQLAAVSAPANKEFKAIFQHDKTRYLARQAEQSNPMLAPLFMHHSNTPNARPVAFQLMDIVSDKQDLSFVEKVQVLEAEILKLCNTLAPASSKGKDNVIVSMDFDALNLQEASVIGFYGDKTFLTKIFKEKNLAPSSLLISMQSNCLRSGLYACVDADSKLYLFYWDARDQFVEASRKDVSCNFVRYLMELCETVFVCVDGKAMGEVAMNEVTILSVQKQRTQRLQVSMRKESENDLKLRKGFNMGLDASLFHTHLMVGLPQGLHRCLVLGASLNKPKLVSRKDFKTERPANLKAWLVSQANSFSIDCCQLPDKDFLLLLRVLDKHEELQKHSRAEEMWKNKQLEVEKKLQHLDRIMKDKKTNLLSAFRSAMECMLLQKYPWEENLLANVDSGQTKFQEGTAGSASSEPSPDCSHLKHEATLCSVWSDQNDSKQRFLYPGSVVEMTSVEKDGESGYGVSHNGRSSYLLRAAFYVNWQVYGVWCRLQATMRSLLLASRWADLL